MQGEQVQSLVGELRFHMPRGAAKKTFFLMNQAKWWEMIRKKMHVCMPAAEKKMAGKIISVVYKIA